MTTTAKYQKKPDYFSSASECILAERNKINTNPRYKNFNQTHFTAGDTDQFEQYKDSTNGILTLPEIDWKNNIFSNINLSESVFFNKYNKINTTVINDTFKYIFDKFKKGIFVKVKNGKLDVFLPFSKKNFYNEWANKIHIDPKYGNMNNFFKHVQDLCGYKFNSNSINKFTDTWYCNNFLIRYEFPINEGDTNVPITSDMFKVLCKERKIPDMEFFINRRDFPILKNDNTEPYDHMFDTENQPLLSHSYEKYAPILSMVSNKSFADIPIPTGDDWARITRKEGKYFERTCSRSFDINPVEWEKRKPIAVFRGSSTGAGITIETNTRLKLAYLSKLGQKDTDNLPFLNAGITEWNTRPRKLKGEKYLQIIDIKNLPISLVPKLSPQEQTEYKYIINVDGHVKAFRLSLELQFESCILLVESKFSLWFSHLLKPFEHYIPIKSDLSDLIEKIKWCKQNDETCCKIAKNAKQFAKKYLSKDGVLDYLQKLLYEIKKVNGFYLYDEITPNQIILQKETKLLERYIQNVGKLITIPEMNRTYGFLQAMEKLVYSTVFNPQNTKTIFTNNKGTVISEYKLFNYNFILKTNSKIIHETFIAKKGLNELSKQIPNFVYIFGLNNESMVMEYIKGQTLYDFIQSDDFSMKKYLFILIQLSLALYMAQQNYGFVHYDFMPWNIIIKKVSPPQEIDYIINYKTVYRIKTSYIPVIIDFERSHIVYKKYHYGNTNIFSHNSIHDILTLLTSSIYEIAGFDISEKEIIILSNFIANTKYKSKPFNSLNEIRYFFGKTRKFDDILVSDKFDLKEKTPLDFVKYIVKNFNYYNFDLSIEKCIKFTNNKHNSKQIFDFCFAETEEKRLLSYSFVLDNILNYDLPDISNVLISYYVWHNLSSNISSLYEGKEYFLEKYNHIMNYLESKYKHNKIEKINYTIDEIKKSSFDLHIFQNPNKVAENLTKNCYDITEFKQVIEYVFLNCDLPENIYNFYEKNFFDLLNLNCFEFKNFIANSYTLKDMAVKIYNKNIEKIEKENCTELNEYVLACKKIL